MAIVPCERDAESSAGIDAVERYLEPHHKGSWHLTLNNHASTRPKDYGGSLVHSVAACKTFHCSAGGLLPAWRCSLDLPHSFTPCDGRRLEVTGYGKTKKEASEVVCRRAMAVLLMTCPGDVVLRPPHWRISPSSLVKGLPGTDTAHQALQSLRRRRKRKEYDRQRHGPPGDRDLTLYFSEINGETCAGPWHFPPNLRVKTIQQRLEDDTFLSLIHI